MTDHNAIRSRIESRKERQRSRLAPQEQQWTNAGTSPLERVVIPAKAGISPSSGLLPRTAVQRSGDLDF
jgi:hypothetical protein